MIDLTDKLDQYLGRGIKPSAVALSYVFDLPEKMFLILPVAVLFATVFTVGSLGRHSELTAAKASGISFHRLVRPLFLAAGTAFVVGLLLGEIAPVATSRRMELLGEKEIRSTNSRYNFVYRADRGWVYAIRALELRTREMMDLMLEREGTGADYPTIVLAAERANYSDSGKVRKTVKLAHWTLHRGTLRYLAGTEPVGEYAFQFDSLHSRTLIERPVDLLAEPKAPDEMRYGELRSYIDALMRSGSNAKKLQVELALKIAIPGAARHFVAEKRRRMGRGGEPRHHVHRAADVPARESGRCRGRVAADACGVDAEYSGRCSRVLSAEKSADLAP